MQPDRMPQAGGVLPVSRVVAWLAGQGVHLVAPVQAELISGGQV